MESTMPLVLVRTPTYRRPSQLKRALNCLQAQTHQDWVCEVRDDCPDKSAQKIIEEINDPRIKYISNRPQQYLIANLDACFRLENQYSADYFFMLEDDNQIKENFIDRGIQIIEQNGVSICQINQVIDYVTENRLSSFGILNGTFDERVYQPEEFHLSLFGGIGISNGGAFWSKNIRQELSFKTDTIPALDEYIRTCMVVEPIYICREKLAVWTQNEEETTRNLGFGRGWLRRELDLKASIRHIRRTIWKKTPQHLQKDFLEGGVLRIPMKNRALALHKADINLINNQPESNNKIKRMAVKYLGRVHPSVTRI
jgi:glycosyltransferase involved in cell wall biosynthesis